jgi:DNA-binding NarL/FixJ family response regulator
MLRIAIAEPDELLGLRMSGQVARAETLEVVGTAGDCSSALDLVRRTHPDVVLVDLFVPPLGGVALIAAITHAVPGTQVVVLVAEAREATLQAAYAAGAVGFVTKDGSLQPASPAVGWFDPGKDAASRSPALRLTAGTGRASRRFTTAGA